MFFTLKLPAKFICFKLSMPVLFILISGLSCVLVMVIIGLYRGKQYFKAFDLIFTFVIACIVAILGNWCFFYFYSFIEIVQLVGLEAIVELCLSSFKLPLGQTNESIRYDGNSLRMEGTNSSNSGQSASSSNNTGVNTGYTPLDLTTFESFAITLEARCLDFYEANKHLSNNTGQFSVRLKDIGIYKNSAE